MALLFVEAFYWFLTLPSDTLAPIQVTEAWIWNELTNMIYGEGSAVISHHNGWLTRIDLQHAAFRALTTALASMFPMNVLVFMR